MPTYIKTMVLAFLALAMTFSGCMSIVDSFSSKGKEIPVRIVVNHTTKADLEGHLGPPDSYTFMDGGSEFVGWRTDAYNKNAKDTYIVTIVLPDGSSTTRPSKSISLGLRNGTVQAIL
jgi:hypothetical protein